MKHRVRLEINLTQLAQNFNYLRSRVAPCRALGVVKADAYGLGAKVIAKTLVDNGAAALGVADVKEAIEVSEFGVPVEILGTLFPEEITTALEYDFHMPIASVEQAKLISIAAVKLQKIAVCHLKLDTGMGRLGLVAKDAVKMVEEIATLPNLKLRGIYSHCPRASVVDDKATKEQFKRFIGVLNALKEKGITFEDVHIAASDAILNYHEIASVLPFTLVRCGIAMYGFGIDEKWNSSLLPVASLIGRLISIRPLEKNSTIGYGSTCVLEEDTLEGTIGGGYADGLPLALSNKGRVIVNGKICPILGRVSMDYTTISLNAVPDAKIGDDVIIFGQDKGQVILMQELANFKGTHCHEVLCSITPRVERVYVK